MRWILQENTFGRENVEQLKAEITKQGHDCEIIKYNLFAENLTDLYDETIPTLFYGSVNLIKQVQRIVSYSGTYSKFLNYNCISYYPYLGKYLLNEDYRLFPIGDAVRMESRVYDFWMGSGLHSREVESQIFFRPDRGDKPYTGQVVNYTNLKEKINSIINNYSIEPHELILFSSCKRIDKEIRYVVANDKVISGSIYSKKGEHYEEYCDDFEFPQMVVDSVKFAPDKVYILDVAYNRGEPKVLELNSFSCADLYDNDFETVIREVSAIAIKEWEEIYI
jgi:hypothetical protein